jgi:hypothetical protein
MNKLINSNPDRLTEISELEYRHLSPVSFYQDSISIMMNQSPERQTAPSPSQPPEELDSPSTPSPDNPYPAGRENWPLVRTYEWSWDPADLNGFPPSNHILDDWLVWRIMNSSLKGPERFRRWPVNFQQKGYVDWHVNGIGRAAKVFMDGEWKYAVVGGVEMHGQEGQRFGRERRTAHRTVTSKETTGATAFLQTNNIHLEDLEYTRRSITAAVQYWDKRKSKLVTKIKSSPLSSPVATPSPPIPPTPSTYANKRHKTSHPKPIISSRLRPSNVPFHPPLSPRFSPSPTGPDTTDDFPDLGPPLDIPDRTAEEMSRDREVRFDELPIETTHPEADPDEHASSRRPISMGPQLRMDVLSTGSRGTANPEGLPEG